MGYGVLHVHVLVAVTLPSFRDPAHVTRSLSNHEADMLFERAAVGRGDGPARPYLQAATYGACLATLERFSSHPAGHA